MSPGERCQFNVDRGDHGENGIQDEVAPESTAPSGNCLRNSNTEVFKGKRKVREQCENRRRNSSNSRWSSQLQNGEVVEAVTLFEVISMGKRAMQSVIDDWIEAYKKDRDVALLDLINFFIQCSGCQGMVIAEMFQSLQNCEVMHKMTEKFDEETGLQYKRFMAYPWILTVTWPVDMGNEDYPLIKAGSYWKRFKTNFCEFTAVLVQQCQCSILYDSYLMDTIISLLTCLADSMVRAFRHTSTLAAMKLLTALVNLNLNLEVSKDNLERLYEVEKKRIMGKKTNSKLDQIERKKREYEQKSLEVENMMNAIFKGTFLPRYRDIIPNIRAICIEEMGIWMRIYPDTFLNDSYLKYLGWMLYDKHPEVRLKCLQALQGIYSQKEVVCKMDLFTSRFKDRIVSMALDRDHEVTVQAMKLLMVMSRNCDDALSAEDCKNLYQFVYSTHRPLAVAAGELLYKRLIIQEIEPESFTKTNGKQESITSQLKTLIVFFLESELHNHVIYLVDSLWDWGVHLLKDWERMTALLLEDAREHERALSDVQESALIEIILATVRQAVEGPPTGRGGIKKILSTKEKKIQMEDCAKITEHFIVVLPQLLAKYSLDTEKVTNLLQISQYFDLERYSTSSFNKNLDALLREVKAIVMTHSNTNILETCSRLYSILSREELTIHNQVAFARAELVNEWVDKLNQLLGIFWHKEDGVSAEEEGIQHLTCTLRQIAAFHNAHDLTKWNLYDKMYKLLVSELEQRPLPIQIILPSLQCAYFALLWQLPSMADSPSSKENIFLLRTHLRQYCNICTSYLSHHNKELCEKAFMILCDLLLILNHQDLSSNGAAGLLEYLPSTSLQTKMLLFIRDHIFGEEEEATKDLKESDVKVKESQKLEALHLKRCLLAAYCKLIVCNIVDITAAAEIYKHYMKAYNDFGDIIKETLSRTRHNNKIQSARTLILCLQQLFQEHIESQGDGSNISNSLDSSSISFNNIKELARRFSLTFGWDQMKSRESVARIHKEGIEFAFQGAAGMEGKCLPPNLNFLVILSEFSNKLLKPDKRLVYSYLLRYVPETALCKEDTWYSLAWYRTSLLVNDDDENSAVSSSQEWPTVNITRTSFKRKLSEGSWSKISHTDRTNRTSETHYPFCLPSLRLRNRKRLKSHDSYHQEYSIPLSPAIPKKKHSTQAPVKEEDSTEAPPEDAEVDVVGAEQNT
ncbi:cohesin subunit SA-2-like isoform X2 [Crotalus tigris]|uniref:cohesin subunit SA-2-like isoform X2 n=1 Tax=Crotalus tigris TaxID=88082 RepID=UPI00192F45FC|nr:cohesin subunit SA-2-like isoform X2 [Crotalus tigris]